MARAIGRRGREGACGVGRSCALGAIPDRNGDLIGARRTRHTGRTDRAPSSSSMICLRNSRHRSALPWRVRRRMLKSTGPKPIRPTKCCEVDEGQDLDPRPLLAAMTTSWPWPVYPLTADMSAGVGVGRCGPLGGTGGRSLHYIAHGKGERWVELTPHQSGGLQGRRDDRAGCNARRRAGRRCGNLRNRETCGL